VLGESHYVKEDATTPSFTSEVIRGYLDYQRNGGEFWGHYRFWTKIGQLVLDRPANGYDREEFWAAVAFYNYVQVPAGDWARQRPTTEAFRASAGAFDEVIAFLRPRAVLVLGAALWQSILGSDAVRFPLLGSGPVASCRHERSVAGTNVAFAAVPHPSSFGFSYSRYAPAVSRFLQLATVELTLAQPGFAQALARMPRVGRDSDFERN